MKQSNFQKELAHLLKNIYRNWVVTALQLILPECQLWLKDL